MTEIDWRVTLGRGNNGAFCHAEKIILPVLLFAMWFVPSVQADLLDQGHAALSAGKYKEALFYLTPAAEQGNAEAQYRLSMMYLMGQGVTQDDKQAIKWLGKAAEQGYADAQFNLGNVYSQPDSSWRNYKLAVQWYRKAVKQGHVMAKRGLAQMYYEGKGVPQDYKQAFYWMDQAAQQSDSFAQYRLGLMYYKGEGTSKNKVEAYKWVLIADSDEEMPVADAPKTRKKLEYMLTPAQMKEGQKRARQFLSRKLEEATQKVNALKKKREKSSPVDGSALPPLLPLPELNEKMGRRGKKDDAY